jgi:predicted HTH domain antitoxin
MATDRRHPQVDDTEELATTIGLYVLGEISLGKAAERTGVTRWEMEEILSEAGIEARLGPQNRDDLEDEVETALDLE